MYISIGVIIAIIFILLCIFTTEKQFHEAPWFTTTVFAGFFGYAFGGGFGVGVVLALSFALYLLYQGTRLVRWMVRVLRSNKKKDEQDQEAALAILWLLFIGGVFTLLKM